MPCLDNRKVYAEAIAPSSFPDGETDRNIQKKAADVNHHEKDEGKISHVRLPGQKFPGGWKADAGHRGGDGPAQEAEAGSIGTQTQWARWDRSPTEPCFFWSYATRRSQILSLRKVNDENQTERGIPDAKPSSNIQRADIWLYGGFVKEETGPSDPNLLIQKVVLRVATVPTDVNRETVPSAKHPTFRAERKVLLVEIRRVTLHTGLGSRR